MRIRKVRRAEAVVGSTSEIVKKSTVGGMRQHRCMGCPGMMIPGMDASGREILKCVACGAQATSRRL